MNPFLLAAPWIAFPVIVPFLLRRRPQLHDFELVRGDPPLVSIIVPARNEAINIGPCLASLLSSDYRPREIIVVDDGSTDATGLVARAMAERDAPEVRVIETEPLPEGWIGKAWACWTGYGHARGELLLFTDADTRHHEGLLSQAVGAMQQSRAALVSLLPLQRMESLWERVVLPHIFLGIALRYPSATRVSNTRNPRQVIANGQFMLFQRSSYEQIGGHRAVRNQVVEDLALAQRIVANQGKLLLAHATDLIETRMYRSLPEIIEGWSKNLALGARLAISPALGGAFLWLGVILGFLLWIVPPFVLLAGLFIGPLGPARAWAALATGAALLGWLYVHLHMRSGPTAAFLYPLGALVSCAVLARSAWRGSRVEWRGRSYHTSDI